MLLEVPASLLAIIIVILVIVFIAVVVISVVTNKQAKDISIEEINKLPEDTNS